MFVCAADLCCPSPRQINSDNDTLKAFARYTNMHSVRLAMRRRFRFELCKFHPGGVRHSLLMATSDGSRAKQTGIGTERETDREPKTETAFLHASIYSATQVSK